MFIVAPLDISLVDSRVHTHDRGRFEVRLVLTAWVDYVHMNGHDGHKRYRSGFAVLCSVVVVLTSLFCVHIAMF